MNQEKIGDTRTGLEIAVIGMTGRFPGAKNIAEFWDNLKNGVESITFFSEPELDEAGIDPEVIKSPDYVRAMGVLEDIEYFDAFFFDYIPAEAEVMDPQMRIFHECTWQALEDAGYEPGFYPGFIGLYAGASSGFNWQALSLLSGAGNGLDHFSIMQLRDKDFMTIKVSYKLNLKGPSFTMYTACSTSLVAINLACQGILSGECDMALAGGINASILQKRGYMYEEGMIASPDGHCRAFDAKSKGTLFGCGVGIVVLKLLDQAIKDRDHIYAVIKGSATNNDGIRKAGFTAPSVDGQVEVIKSAMQMAVAAPESIGYVETHGTGTSLGDPVEIAALKLAFETEKRGYCALGSVKTNVGHLDSAAGIAGFIKTVLILKHKLIPPSLHFTTPNPQIDFENSPFYVNTRLREWKDDRQPLRAGVSSFGIGGTNAHVILEEWPEDHSSTARSIGQGNWTREYKLIPLSAKTQSALETMRENMANYLKENPAIHLADAAYTLQVGRRAFKHRKMVLCRDVDDTADSLSSANPEKVKTHVINKEDRPIIFMFSGQGSQYVNMGLELYRKERIFREAVDCSFEILKPLLGYDLRGVLYPGFSHLSIHNDGNPAGSPADGRSLGGTHLRPETDVGTRRAVPSKPAADINQTEIAQPVLFVLEYALAKLLLKWGIEPKAMIGHSIGEYVAACLSGVFSLEDALRLVVYRGKLMQQMPPGLMLSVAISEEELNPLIEDKKIALAAVNSSRQCVVSGTHEVVQGFAEELEGKGYETRRVHTSHAFHSQMMEPILAEFEAKVKGVKLARPNIPYISNVSGNWIKASEAVDAGYWSRQIRSTVRFADGLQELLKEEEALLVEVGPGKALCNFVRQHNDRKASHSIMNLVRHAKEDYSDHYYLLSRLGQLWLYGVQIDWAEFYRDEKRYRISLPTYPFERKRYWIKGDPFKIVLEMMAGATDSSRKPGKREREEFDEPGSRESDAEVVLSTPQQVRKRPELLTDYFAPRSETEMTLAEIWQRFFGIDRIGIFDDFFELGGDSLKVMTVASHIHKALNIVIPIQVFFARPTINKLGEYIAQGSKDAEYYSIKTVETKEFYSLSSAQKRLYILQQLDKHNINYNQPSADIVEMELDKKRIEESLRRLIERHESLRTSFEIIEGEVVQKIYQSHEMEFAVEYYDLTEIKGPGGILLDVSSIEGDLNDYPCSGDLPVRWRRVVEKIIQDFVRSFDLSLAPLFRVGLIKVDDGRYVLMVDLHHIISDGISNLIFVTEFILLYKGERLPVPKVQYKDFSEWQNDQKISSNMRKQEEYWLKEFEGEIPVLNLPLDYPRPVVQSSAGDEITFEINIEETKSLKDFALKKGTTLYMVLLAIFNVLFSKLSNQEDIIIGSPIAGRRHPDLERLIGMFVNTLALRNYPVGYKTFNEFAAEVKERTLEAFENQEYQFEDLVEKAVVNRDTSRNPIFDVMFVFQNVEMQAGDLVEIEIPDSRIIPYDYKKKNSKFDINLTGAEAGERLLFSVEYCTELFKKPTLEKFIFYTRKIVSAVNRNPDLKLHQIEIVSEEEKQEILYEFNETGTGYPATKTIHQLFEEQVFNSPDNIAVVGPTQEVGTRVSLTYRQLNDEADLLAGVLIEKGVEPEAIVCIMLGRSIEMIVGILATLKAGGVYLPIDSDYPGERKRYILRDSGAEILLTTGNMFNEVEKLRGLEVETIFIDEPGVEQEALGRGGARGDVPSTHLSPAPATSLAYVIYTSGSTGEPKGVMIEHRSLVNYVWWGMKQYLGTKRYIFPLYTRISFDLTVTSIYLPLLSGNTILIYSNDETLLPIQKVMEEGAVDVVKATPSHIRILPEDIESENFKIKKFIVGGEQLEGTLAEEIHRRVSGNIEIYNEYGPTEATVGCMIHKFDYESDTQGPVPIGTPIDNARIYILDDYLNPLPSNVAGGIYIGGDTLARGYINRPSLTEQSFLANPFVPGERIYKTGDIARRLPDGNIEFLGRMDEQVKIRGFRIELGEIENQLLSHEKIKETVVIAKENTSGEKYLSAYIVANSSHSSDSTDSPNSLDASQLREYLLRKLPEYMIPSRFTQILNIPLTSNGKLDKRALDLYSTQLVTGMEYVAPENEKEEKIACIWEEILELDKIGIHDNFFELGGNSLKLIQVNTRLREIFARDIPIVSLFRYSTIRALSRYISQAEDRYSLPASDRIEELNKGKNKLKALKTKLRER